MSLSNLFEVKDPHDLLKGLLNTLNEYDQSKDKEDTGDKPKMVRSSLHCNLSSKLGPTSATVSIQVE